MPRKTKDSPPTDSEPQDPEAEAKARHLAEARALLRRAEAGDESALTLVRERIQRPDFWLGLTSLTATVEDAIITRMAGRNLLVRESTKARLAHMRAELGGSDPSALEKLLIDRIALLWLQLSYFEVTYTQNLSDMTIPQAEHHQRRIDGTHRRYLAAIKALAVIRRLAVPVVQLNVAQAGARQLNVAAPGPLLADGDSAEDRPAL